MSLRTPLFFFFGLALHLGAAECNAPRSISVRLINDAAVKPNIVTVGKQEAAWVLKSLCVDVEWAAQGLEMHITVRPLGPDIPRRALGVTILDAGRGNRGAVFFSRVCAMEERYRSLMVDLGRLLGCVLAHEIGHLLLNSKAHSPEGIMVENFGEAEVLRAKQRRLIFTRSEREIFSRSQIARRLSVRPF